MERNSTENQVTMLITITTRIVATIAIIKTIVVTVTTLRVI